MFDIYFIVALVIVIVIHEFSHAFVANLLGDPTAKLKGRISLNPLKHLDVVGTLMLFIVGIGWGKPVPVNDHYFRNPKRDNALTAFAGPLANLLLAFALAIPLNYFSHLFLPQVEKLLLSIFDVSILLFAFNMLPFPPLDGSKLIGILIPDRFQLAYERYLSQGIIYFAIFLLFDQFVLVRSFQYSILQVFIGKIFVWVKAIILFGS